MASTVRLIDLFDPPPAFEAVASDLEEVLEKVGLSDYTLAIQVPLAIPTDPDPVPEMSDDEALAELEWYEGEEDVEPEPVTIPQDVIPAASAPGNTVQMQFQIAVLSEVVIDLAGLEGVSLVLNPGGFSAQFTASADGFAFGFSVALGIRLSPAILRPYRRVTASDGRLSFMPDESRIHTQINLASVAIAIDHTGSISLDAGAGIQLEEPVMIGDTGLIIENADIELNLSGVGARPAGTPPTWIGLLINNASLRIPDVFSGAITATGLGIGSGGVSGAIGATFPLDYTNGQFTGDLVGEVFSLEGGLSELSLTLQQNIPAGGGIKGLLKLPFFGDTDEALAVDIGFAVDGTFTVAIDRADGLIELRKQDLLSMRLDSVGFEAAAGRSAVRLSGQLTPEFGDLDWPAFAVRELSIDSDGNVALEGGWLDLPEQYSLDFHGIDLDLTKLGFGTQEDGGKWMGFSGAVKLLDGLPAGASVEGLRVIWYDDGALPDVTLNGIGVELAVPNVLDFKGAVSYRELPGDVHRFDGAIKLNLIALQLQLDGQLVIGRHEGEPYLAIFLDTEFPSGIPLWATGLGLYGVAGLFALDLAPGRQEAEPWYGLNPPGWYQRNPVGVTELAKWDPAAGRLALGAGVTIGTVADNGYAFSGRVMLILNFPGPILLIEGRASLLTERAKREGQEPHFRALAVIDTQADSFLLGVDAKYRYGSGGELIDIGGSAEAFFVRINGGNLWHLYVGLDEPRAKRVRAALFGGLFEANAYFMLKPSELREGAWIGYDEEWEFGPLDVTLEAWIEHNATLSWKPTYVYGDLWLHGKAGLSVYGYGVSLTVDAQITARVFEPFEVTGTFTVGINLPWFLPDFDVDVSLTWGPDEVPTPLPLPLKEVAVEHLKVSTTWPLPQGELLRPIYDSDREGFRDLDDPPAVADDFLPATLPVVPLDARPRLTFGRPVVDAAGIGGNPQPVFPNSTPDPEWEWIGDPARNEGPVRVRYTLTDLGLERRDPLATPSWQDALGTLADGELYGSWAPVPQVPGGEPVAGSDDPVANTKLWLWSKSAFDFSSHGGQAWTEWFTGHHAGYPCIPLPPDREICCTFEGLEPDPTRPLTTPFPCPEHPGIVFSWPLMRPPRLERVSEGVEGLTHALCFPDSPLAPEPEGDGIDFQPYSLTIHLDEPAKRVAVLHNFVNYRARAFTKAGMVLTPTVDDQPRLEFTGRDLVRVVLDDILVLAEESWGGCVFSVCATIGLDDEEIAERLKLRDHLVNEVRHWASTGFVLEPDTTYRLRIVTTLESTASQFNVTPPDDPPADYEPPTIVTHTQTQYAYFKTEGPPGLAALTVSDPAENRASGLADLVPYVRQTVPATVPAPGQRPPLPRPVYRAYDVGVVFNEDYVEHMYRMSGRDLGLYLFDPNNRPVRDAQGRLIVLSNRWGDTETLTLSKTETDWITTINASTCAAIDLDVIPHDATMATGATGQVLEPDAVYEARLIPLLLHDGFDAYPLTPEGQPGIQGGGRLGRWRAFDEPDTVGGPSSWEIHLTEGSDDDHHLRQTTNIQAGSVDAADPVKPGTMLLYDDDPALAPDDPDQPSNWTDYRLNVLLRSLDNDAIGVVFRHQNDATYYRFSMAMEQGYRHLVRVVNGDHTVLAEDDIRYVQDRSYVVTVDALGPSMRVYLDGELIFDVVDDAPERLDRGSVGLYCWAEGGPYARFDEVRVDDFRPEAPVVYRFKFTTSRFANFFHQLHSFQDETWPAPLTAGAATDDALRQVATDAATPETAPADAEHRAYDALAALVLGPAKEQNPTEVEVSRVDHTGAPVAYLIRSPEPVDWTRTSLKVFRTDRLAPAPELPYQMKLTDVTFATDRPNQESVTLLLREAMNPTGHRIEYRRLAGPIAAPPGDPVLQMDEFEDLAESITAVEAAGNPLDRYQVVDETTEGGSSRWELGFGGLRQRSATGAGPAPDRPGTLAVTGSEAWADYVLNVEVVSDDAGAVGVVVRYLDQDNYYRLSLTADGTLHLVKKLAGVVTELRSPEQISFVPGEPVTLTVEAVGSRITAYQDGAYLFEVVDVDAIHLTGKVGLYTWQNPNARFARLDVQRPSPAALALFRDRFATDNAGLTGWEFVDEAGVTSPAWVVADGALVNPLSEPGALALAGDPEALWTDFIVTARLLPREVGEVGIVWRYLDAQNHYRFSISREGNVRRLVKNVGGVVTLLWEDAAHETGDRVELTVAAIGATLRGYRNGVPLFVVEDSSLAAGRAGLYSRGTVDATFSDVVVYPAALAFADWLLDEPFDRSEPARWEIVDQGSDDGPSEWILTEGELRQRSNIHQDDADPLALDLPGTNALLGDPSWSDYRVSVRLSSQDSLGAIGVYCRYQDTANFYRFAMDSQRQYRRFIKVVAGEPTLLWADDVVFVLDRDYLVTITCIGNRLTGFIDGVEVFALDDVELASGRVGLYAAGNDDARFAEVRVDAPAWAPYFRFDRVAGAPAERLPAGTRIRVFAGRDGDPDDPALEEPGVIRRFVAAQAGAEGAIRFPAGGVDLRLRGPQGEAGHARRFLPDTAYQPVAAVVARRADGTDLALTVLDAAAPAGIALPAGQYRLRWTYLRNNGSGDDAQIFSEAGNRDPEVVVTDVPWKDPP